MNILSRMVHSNCAYRHKVCLFIKSIARSTALGSGSNGAIQATNAILAVNSTRPTYPRSTTITSVTFIRCDTVSGGLLLSRSGRSFSSTAPATLKLAKTLCHTLCDVSRRRTHGFGFDTSRLSCRRSTVSGLSDLTGNSNNIACAGYMKVVILRSDFR